jgi:hypothetical protein
MSNIAKFGLRTPYDLYEKLKYDAEQLLRRREESDDERRLEEFEAFNFFVTAWHLHKDWLHGRSPAKPKHALEKIKTASSKLMEIKQVIRDIANGSKHFELEEKPKVVVGEREISSFFAYFFGPQFPIDTKSFHFLMYELVDVIMDYFEWLFDDTQPIIVPPALLGKLEKARVLRGVRKKNDGNAVA